VVIHLLRHKFCVPFDRSPDPRATKRHQTSNPLIDDLIH
jgi:hypothetical protein